MIPLFGDTQGERGFTLLEVTVAVAIAGLALVSMFEAASTGLFAVNSAARVEEAIERAQSRLAAFSGTNAIIPGESEGDDGGGYHWRFRARPVMTRQPLSPAQADTGTSLYDVEVMISWRAAGRTRSVVLASRRIGNAVAAQ